MYKASCEGMVSLNYRTSIAHHDCLHLAGRCYTSGATISARAKNKKGLRPGEHVPLFRMKWDRNKGFSEKSANWRPPSHCALNGLGNLCLGMYYRLFKILSRMPKGVSNKHSYSDHNFLRTKLFFGQWGGGGLLEKLGTYICHVLVKETELGLYVVIGTPTTRRVPKRGLQPLHPPMHATFQPIGFFTATAS